MRGWRRAAELACDRAAAQRVGDPLFVAAALVACARFQAAHPAARAAMGVANDDLELRVRTLLDDGPERDEAGRSDLHLAARAALLGGAAAAFVGALGGHHLLETVLFWVS